MRKLLFISILTLHTTLSITSFGQSTASQKTEQEVKNMLCHKWKVSQMEVQGKRIGFPPDWDASIITFNNDGTLIEVSEGKSYQGKWTYEHKTMSIITNDKDGIEKQQILKITSNQLIIKSKYQEMPMNLIMQRID
jgi:hypothetical protein